MFVWPYMEQPTFHDGWRERMEEWEGKPAKANGVRRHNGCLPSVVYKVIRLVYKLVVGELAAGLLIN